MALVKTHKHDRKAVFFYCNGLQCMGDVEDQAHPGWNISKVDSSMMILMLIPVEVCIVWTDVKSRFYMFTQLSSNVMLIQSNTIVYI